MIVEVIAVGTELLIGQIVNTNAAFIGARLAEEGFDAHYQVTVGDNLDRLVSAIETAVHRADAIVLCGGIGPTQDDLTREAMARVAGRTMVRDHDHASWIEARVMSQSGSVNPTVLRMADLPEGAVGLPNANGVALGVALEHEGHWMFAVPGVPVEMRAMLDGEVMPRLRRLAGEATVLRSRLLRTWGIGESRIAEALDDLFESANPSVAFLITDMEVKIRVSAKAADAAAAARLIAPVEERIRDTLGEAVFGADDDTVERIVVERLVARRWTAATLEEATLGQVGARIAIAGKHVLKGSAIAAGQPPPADVMLTVGPIGPDLEGGPRTTRQVEMEVTTPAGVTTRAFDFGGDDERVRSFATIAGLHLVRLALEAAG
ncbi:MAG TPA: CinA family nicotinamide mononucleotide deamidase-related protein [Acidimicrobiia bacterium]|nr:CinA family nicotinamide mononucleotide deamidase-related protein [Acidimicrobiia bacterium]